MNKAEAIGIVLNQLVCGPAFLDYLFGAIEKVALFIVIGWIITTLIKKAKQT